MVRNCFYEHSLARSWRAIEQYATRRVDTNLPVQIELRQGKFYGLSDLLLLNIQTTDVAVFDVWSILGA